MKHRLFLFILVFVLILVNALLTKTMDANPFGPDAAFLGIVPWWELQIPLGLSLFAAASFMAALGIGAIFWLALLPLCGARRIPESGLLNLARCSAWCAWPLGACCITSLAAFCFPWLQRPDVFASLDGRSFLMLQMGVGLILMLMLPALLERRSAGPSLRLAAVFLIAALALSCGLLWWWGQALPFLVIAMAGSLALILLLPQPDGTRSRLAALLALSTALCVYVIGFGSMMPGYAPLEAAPAFGQHQNAVGAGILIALIPLLLTRNKQTIALTVLLAAVFIGFFMLLPTADADLAPMSEQSAAIRFCAGIAAGLTIALSLSPTLRNSLIGLRVCALLTLASGIVYTWVTLYTPIAAAAGMDEGGHRIGVGCYLCALLLMLALGLTYRLLRVPRASGDDSGDDGRSKGHRGSNAAGGKGGADADEGEAGRSDEGKER